MSVETKPSPTVVKVTEIGDALGVVLPSEVVADLAVASGDELLLTCSPDGYRLTRSKSEFERQMTVARRIMKKRFDVLRELAT